MGKITDYYKSNVLPTLLGLSGHGEGFIAEVFPLMEWQSKPNKWISRYHIDGSQSSSTDQCYINKSDTEMCIHDNNGTHISIIDMAMSVFGLQGRYTEAVLKLGGLCGLESPDINEEYQARRKAKIARDEALKASLHRQQTLLWSAEGKVVLDYLRNSRGYSDDLIKRMGLGYLNPTEANILGRILGEELHPKMVLSYPLSFAYVSDRDIYGFKFRAVLQSVIDLKRGKYRNTESLKGQMSTHPYLYNTEAIRESQCAVIVEGELDALHAYAEGITNVIATSGGKATQDTLTLLFGQGIQTIVFVPDNDSRGAEFVKEGIRCANMLKLDSYVAVLPDGKDADEYLTKHTTEGFAELIRTAQNASAWEYGVFVDKWTSLSSNRQITDIEVAQLKREFYTLASGCRDEVTRAHLIAKFAQGFAFVPGVESVMTDEVKRIRAEKEREKLDAETTLRVEEITKALATCDYEGARELMVEYGRKARPYSIAEKIEAYKHIPTMEEITATMRKGGDGYITRYMFSEGNTTEPLVLARGGITAICAPTSHGKSTMLQNIALDMAKDESVKGSILYFTLEETTSDVLIQMQSKYIGQKLSDNNRRTIGTYLKTGQNYFAQERNPESGLYPIEEYQRGTQRFYNELISGGKLRVYDSPTDSGELAEVVDALCATFRVDAVFIDYIGRMDKQGKYQAETYKMSAVMDDLLDMAIRNNVIVVMAGQINRSGSLNPMTMSSQNIADCADIERGCASVVLLWNSTWKGNTIGLSQTEVTRWQDKHNITLGESGKLFLLLAKNRQGTANLSCTLLFDGNIGKITEAPIIFI